MNARHTTESTLEQVRLLLERADEAPTLQALAESAQLSPSHLQRAFRRRYGMSPAEYHRARRFGQLKTALRKGAAVTDAVYDAGFGSGSRVYEHSDRLLGMTPASYRAGGAGASIRFTTTGTPLGRLLVATTTRGICSVTLADTDAELETRLTDEFPHAALERVDAGREEWLDAVIARIASELGWSDVAAPDLPPLDVAAPAFQWPQRRNQELWRTGCRTWHAKGGPRHRQRLRQQPTGTDRAVPPHRARGRLAGWLALGRGTQTRTAGQRTARQRRAQKASRRRLTRLKT